MHLAQEFEQLWDSGDAPPDVLGFLQQQKSVDSDQWLAVLLSDQRRRWLTDGPLRVEDYLVGLPDLPEDVDWKLQLAVGEFEARRDTERPLSQDEISSRFADISDTLRERIQGLLPQHSPKLPAAGGSAAPELMETEIRIQDGLSSTVTYISSTGIGVAQKGRYRLDRVPGEGGFGRVYLGFDEELQRQVASGRPGLLEGQFGKYSILKQLGGGGMGAVYLAEDTTLGRQVALKVPILEGRDGDSVLPRFEREARAAARLQHPHICSLLEFGTIEGTIYMALPFIEGSPLTVGSQPWSVQRAFALGVVLADALQYAHELGILHRDLKPSNILIDQRGQPCIIDFGLAKFHRDPMTELTETGQMLGTPAYMPPEQFNAKSAETGPASDIYSLGAVVYQLIAGEVPFKGELFQLMGQIIADPPPPPSSLAVENRIPRIADQIVLKALAKSSQDRYTSMSDFGAAMRAVLIDDPPSIGRPLPALRIVGTDTVYCPTSTQQEISVGRQRSSPGNDLVIRCCDDEKTTLRISRRHFQIKSFSDGCRLVDCSRAGVTINGEAIPSRTAVPLKIGDTIGVVGALQLEVIEPEPSRFEPFDPNAMTHVRLDVTRGDLLRSLR